MITFPAFETQLFTLSTFVAAAALGLIPSRKGILRNLRLAAATEKGHKKDASQVDHRAAKMAAAAAAGSEEEALLTSEFYEGINVKVELMLSSDDDDNGVEEKAEIGNKEQAESETSAASPDVAAVERANSKAETATNSICSASGGVRAASAANGKQQQQQWTVKDKKLSLVIVKPAASESGGGGDGDERCNHRSGIIAEFPPLPSPSPPPQSSRECSDHSGHLHCYRSNLVTGGGGEPGEKRSTAETVTVGVSANGESGVGGKKKKRKRRRRKRNRRDDGDADGDLGDSERRLGGNSIPKNYLGGFLTLFMLAVSFQFDSWAILRTICLGGFLILLNCHPADVVPIDECVLLLHIPDPIAEVGPEGKRGQRRSAEVVYGQQRRSHHAAHELLGGRGRRRLGRRISEPRHVAHPGKCSTG